MTLLGCIGATARRVLSLALGDGDPNRRGCSYAVTVITPISPGRTGELRELVRSYGPGPASPLAKVPDVQFARWVIIDQLRTDWAGAPKPPPRLKSDYLLFSADVTAPAYRAGSLPDSFFRDLATHTPADVDKVWGHCRRYPGSGDVERFAAYMKQSQITIGLYYAAFPDATVDDINHALHVRAQLGELALTNQHVKSARDLRRAYVKRAASW